MPLPRGFITKCEKTAHELRMALGLEQHAFLNPRQLAAHLGIKIWTPEEIPGMDPSVIHQLLRADASSWSAVTLTIGHRAVIIINSSHSAARKNNDLAHELAHIILKHEPTQMFCMADGTMMIAHYKRDYEDEADTLGHTLLVPRDSLHHFLKLGHSDSQLADHFGVSMQLLTMRKNKTGLAKQMSYRRA